jgi:hypothetical protein
MKRRKHFAKIGQRFERLTVEWIPDDCTTGKYVGCLCDCGVRTSLLFGSLVQGFTRSCGCLRDEKIARVGRNRNFKHGQIATGVYAIWGSMIARCHSAKAISYPNYGARGIRVCARWRKSFAAFFSDIGPRPSKDHSLDRIDVNGNYEPGNCRWADRLEQQNNRRNNHMLTLNGVTLSMAQWARKLGFSRHRIYARLKNGWSVERALTHR